MKDKQMNSISNRFLLSEKNLYKLLVFLRNTYPMAHAFRDLIKRMGLKGLTLPVLKDLEKADLITESILSRVKKLSPEIKDSLPHYEITTKGIEFVNSMEVRNLSRTITWFTKILVVFGIITIVLMSWQIILQYCALS